GVGRTTLREALRLLETRGVLTIRPGPGGGPIVRHPKPADLSESLTLILRFRHASLGEVRDARRALEPMIANLAAEEITEEEIAELQASVQWMLDHTHETDDVFMLENTR